MAATPEEIVASYYGPFFGVDQVYDLTVSTQNTYPLLGLYSFKVKFNKTVHQKSSHGLVDPVNNFIVANGKITTNAAMIANIVATYTNEGVFLNDPSSNPYLIAYLNTTTNQVALVRSDNSYAIIKGQTFSFNSLFFSTFLVFFSTAPDLSSGQGLLFGAPYPYNFQKNIIDGYKWIQWGSKCAPKTLFFIIDLNCPFCNALYLSIKYYVQKGELQVKISTGSTFVGAPNTSRGKAWAMYEGKVPFEKSASPEEALRYNETFYTLVTDTSGDFLSESGGLVPINDPNKCAQKAVSKSTASFFLQGYAGLPTIFWYDATTGLPFVGMINTPTPAYPPAVPELLLSLIKNNFFPKVKTISCAKSC
jgi:hypothetical protein